MVTEKQGMFVFVVGLILTMFAVGGVENSITDSELLTSVLVAVTGLGCMFCGTVMIKRAD
jgi:uncharacterized membrane protein